MWSYQNPVKIYFGEGSIGLLDEILRDRGYGRVVLFSRKLSRLSPSAQRAIQAAMPRVVKVFDEISPEPTTADIARAVEKLDALVFDAVVAIGGGSVIDTAKAAAAFHANRCDIDEYMEHGGMLSASLPIIAIPTTSGTGSEVTRAAALTHKGKKQPIFDDSIFPTVSVVDPVLTYSCPPSVTASCGFDVLSHACESLMHKKASPMSEMLAKDAIRLCVQSLEQCCTEPGDCRARRGMSEASLKAGLAIAASGCTAAHACSYKISTDFRIPHGEACAFTLDKLISLCAEHDDRFDHIAAEIGFRDARAFAKWIAETKHKLHLRTNLQEIGADEADKDRLIEAGLSSAVARNHYFEMNKADIARLFE